MQVSIRLKLALASALVGLLAGCGGGQGAPDASITARNAAAVPMPAAPVLPPQAAASAAQAIAVHRPACHDHCLAGTAAVGAAFANGVVNITDSAGRAACQQSSITTSADGTYTCTLQAGETAPFFVVVTDPTGNNQPVVSATTSTPGNGRPLVVNATPLTTAILAQLSPNGNPLTLVSSGSVDPQALASLTAAVVAQLGPVLSSVNAPAGYDPFSTPIVAATPTSSGNAADAVLDLVQVVTMASGPALQTVGSTTSVPLGTTQQLAAPSPGAVSLVSAQQALAAQVSQCFALSTSQRVLAADTSIPASQGGAAVTQAAPACAAIAASLANGADQQFLHNGYTFGQLFYGMLTRDSMTGAAISVPQDMVYLPGDPTASPPKPDRAVLNFRFVDNQGNPGNFIVVAADLTAAPAPGWWIVGNQDPIDVNLRAVIRRIENVNPNPPSWAISHFVSGIQPIINALGPGSIRHGQPMSAVRLTGPGLPLAGLVFIAPAASEVHQYYMDLSNVTGTVPPGGRCGGQIAGNCPLFWLQRTVGLTGTAATTLAPNPAGAFLWLQSGTPVASGEVAKGSVYTFEVFYGAATTPAYTFRKMLIAQAVPVTQGDQLQWNGLGPTSSALLDPANSTYNGTLTFAVNIDWTQNPLAEQIAGATMSIDYKGTLATSVGAAPGATSLTFPAMNTPPLTTQSMRQILFGYRTLDGYAKSAMYEWN